MLMFPSIRKDVISNVQVIHVFYVNPLACVEVLRRKLDFRGMLGRAANHQQNSANLSFSMWRILSSGWQDTRLIFLFYHSYFSLTGSHGANCAWQLCRAMKAHSTDSGAHTSQPGSELHFIVHHWSALQHARPFRGWRLLYFFLGLFCCYQCSTNGWLVWRSSLAWCLRVWGWISSSGSRDQVYYGLLFSQRLAQMLKFLLLPSRDLTPKHMHSHSH